MMKLEDALFNMGTGQVATRQNSLGRFVFLYADGERLYYGKRFGTEVRWVLGNIALTPEDTEADNWMVF